MYSWSGKAELMPSMEEKDGRVIMSAERFEITPNDGVKEGKMAGKHPLITIAAKHDDEGRPLFEVDGKVVGPADGVLMMLLSWKRTEGGKAVWDQIDAFTEAFVRI